MNSKQFYVIIVAVIFIVALIFYHDQMTIFELIGSFVSSGAILLNIYQWLTNTSLKKQKNHIEYLYKQQLQKYEKLWNKMRQLTEGM